MSDVKNETKGTIGENTGGSRFAQEGVTASAGAAAATAAAKEDAPADYSLTGKWFTSYLNKLIRGTPEVLMRRDTRDLVVVELQADGQLNCYERGTEVKHLIPLDDRALDLILPQVLKV